MASVKKQSIVIDKTTYASGMKIRATEASAYKGLYGHIIEILDGKDKTTDNDTVDIACEFYPPDNDKEIDNLEQIFTKLYGGRKTINDIALDYVIMSPEMICSVKKCRIYQIPAGNKLTFCSLYEMRKMGFDEVPRNIYELVYDGELGTDDLETIFMIFNVDYPEDYTARSLSVSDVVELYDDNGSSFYYCQSCNFEKIQFDESEKGASKNEQ